MFLGIGIGTSGVKSVLMDGSGAVVATASSALSVSRPRPGWSEQDPADWWQAVCDTLDRLKDSHPAELSGVAGIGLSGQMHGATLLDGAHKVLRPAILWNDGRSGDECALLESRADVHGIAGNLAMPGFTAPKIEWVRRHEPEVYAATRLVLLPKDYVRLQLTGEAVSDMSDAAGTLWLDVARRDWSDELLEATGLTREAMPRLVEGTDSSGRLRSDLVTRWGFSVAPVVAGGGGDNAASACGIGAVRPGEAFLSLGTSGVLFVATDRYRPNTAGAVHAFCHALPGIWHQMGVILSATDSLNWLSEITGADVATLEQEGARTHDERGGRPSDLVFLPYLSGERTPHNDPAARGGFAGIARANGRADLSLAVLEGVAFAFRDCLDVLKEAGSEVSRVTAVGGGARSRAWLQILANLLGATIDCPAQGDFGAAYGAARLGKAAALGSGETGLFTPPEMSASIDPDPARAEEWRAAHQRYRALYPALKEVLS
ncbi:MAG: xylulokinase [Stappia sp.]|uniref:xylulokinase n=1 Tax=Stappia sp. TaxID=1870903 RepID=UPI000C6B9A68|nr:xylulokinase [Stappia sp.]MBM22582.1 xylulokinase [Stappia sp.]